MGKHTQLGKVLDREHEKHRNVIAAAPDMLEALHIIKSQSIKQCAQAAIAKAEGRT